MRMRAIQGTSTDIRRPQTHHRHSLPTLTDAPSSPSSSSSPPPITITITIAIFIIQEAWVDLGSVEDFPTGTGTPVLYGGVQLAVFRYATNEWYATQNMSPKRRAFVLSEGLLGSADGVPKIACPLHKNQFALTTGECIDDPSLQIMTFNVRVTDGRVEAFLPPTSKLDSVLSTEDNYLRAIETEGSVSTQLDSILDAEIPSAIAAPSSTFAGVGNATAV